MVAWLVSLRRTGRSCWDEDGSLCSKALRLPSFIVLLVLLMLFMLAMLLLLLLFFGSIKVASLIEIVSTLWGRKEEGERRRVYMGGGGLAWVEGECAEGPHHNFRRCVLTFPYLLFSLRFHRSSPALKKRDKENQQAVPSVVVALDVHSHS
jgi:amino acid permease